MYVFKLGKTSEIEESLVPPMDLIFDGSPTLEAFRVQGEGAVREYILHRAKLKPHENVLDIGSGIGKIARPLTLHLDENGSYDGIEIVEHGVSWCNEHYAKYSNFNFHHSDIYSKYYNEGGKHQAADYKFPFADESMDLVILRSVFTHMLEPGIENYVSEIGRVLRSGGRCFVTGFYLNEDSKRRNDQKMGNWHFAYPHGKCRLWDKEFPEKGVAQDEGWLRSLFSAQNMDLADATYGDWCGRKVTLPTIQDAWILIKS